MHDAPCWQVNQAVRRQGRRRLRRCAWATDMLCYTIGLLMMLRHVRTMNLPSRAVRARPFHALRRLPPVATFGRTLSTKRLAVPSMMEAAVANGRSEAEQHTFFNGKVTTTVLPAEPPAPA